MRVIQISHVTRGRLCALKDIEVPVNMSSVVTDLHLLNRGCALP